MRKLFRFSFLIVPALFLFSLSARSQVFSGIYNFANVTNSSGTTDPTPAPTATGLTFSSFTAVGQTTLNPNAGGRFSFTGHPTGATTASDIFTGSINTNQYYQVTITPTPGYSLDINSIAFTLQRSATGIRQYAVRSSLDYNTNLPAGISPANTDLSVVSTNVFQVSDATSSAEDGSTITLGSSYDAITSAVTFRFYGWNAEASGGTFSIDNVTINGVANAITALPSVTLSVSTNSGTEADATAITVTATASEAVTGNQTIDLGVSGVNITSGDYTLSGGSITILSGQTTGTATFTVVDDNLAEGAETAALTISNPSAGIVLGSTTAQNITITDNDAAPSVSIAAGLDAAEPATNGTFTINLSSPAPAGGLTVTYTLNGSATLNTDYSDALNGSIVIPEGSLNGTITLSVSNDIFIEGTETIGITLSTVSNSFVIGSPNSATINLNDNDNPPVVINEVYGGGGNTGANFKNDFIELYNNSNTAVNLAGWSVQYNSATGTGAWQVTNLTGSIPAHSYYLVQEGAGAGGVADLPTPDATGGIAMAAGSGKVALVNNTTALSGNNPLNSSIVDKVGYGTVAIGFEGTGPAPAPSAINSIQRTPIGSDANQNGTDFTADLPTPKNSITDITAPLVSVLSPANGAVNVTTASTASITFNENIEKGTGSITLRKTSDGSILKTFDVTDAEVTVAGSSASFLIQGLAFTTSYYLEVSDGAFKDLSGNSFAGFTGNSTWSFTSGNMPLGIVGNLYNFNSCTTGLTDGFSLFSVVGPQVWACTTFGRDAANPPSGSAANGLQINGFSGTNILNEDWLISPAFDLTATNFPLLSFWSRTKI
ncbi:MAG: lamin tail domain-containing protein [Chitinophagaceae bacterium]|nr:lamin tail domain-containing protein [Chitinophagaceae bacterium]